MQGRIQEEAKEARALLQIKFINNDNVVGYKFIYKTIACYYSLHLQ